MCSWGGGLAGLTCVQDVWQDSDDTELTVLTGLLHHVFIQDLTQTFRLNHTPSAVHGSRAAH